MSGLDFLAGIAAGTIARPPAAELLGLDLEEVCSGRVVFGFDAAPGFGSPFRVHGGILAAVTDFAVSCAVLSTLAPGAGLVTADLHVSYLRAVDLDGSRLHCTGQVIHLGRTQANATAEITGPSGQPSVLAVATCRIRRAEDEALPISRMPAQTSR